VVLLDIKKIKNVSLYSASVYISQFVFGVSSILIKNILGPLLTGKFAFLNMLYRYMTYGHLGIRFSIDKNLPSIYNESLEEDIKKFESKSINSVLFLELCFFIILSIGIFIFYNPPTSKYLVYTMLLAGVFFSINELYKVIYRAQQRTIDIAKYTLSYYIFFSLTQLITVYIFGFDGLIISILFYNVLFFLVYFLAIKKERISFNLDFSFMKERIKDGLPLFINGLIMFTLLNIDKWFILSYFNEEQLGYYSVATMFFSMFMILPNTLTEVLFPDLIIKIGNERKEKIVIDLVDDIYILSKIFYLLISTFIFLLPLFIKFIMPDYRLSISVARVLVIGIFSFAISGLGSYLLMGYNKKKTILSISGFSLFVAIFLNYILLNYFYMDIISIAIASALTYLIYGFIYLFILFNLSNFRLNKKYIYIIIFHLLKIIIVLIVNIFYQFEIIYFVIVFLFILDTIFEMMTIYAEVSNK